MMIKKITALVLVVLCVAGMSACTLKKESVSLTIWGPEEATGLLKAMASSFKAEYGDKADFNITIGIEEEKTVGEVVRKSPETAADIFIFPSDQLHYLIGDGILLPVSENVDKIIFANGGEESGCISGALMDGKLYAYPQTSSNGYFMYYNKAYFAEDDLKSLDRMLEIAEENDKKIAMDWSSGWYIYSFFGGAGFTLEMDESGKNNCNWNETVNGISGTDVAEAMLAIADSDGFLNCADDALKAGFADDSIIAGVNGTWNAQYLSDTLGDNYGACMLPTYTLCGEQVQMGSFAGYKYVGVNSSTDSPEWAQRLGEWITNYDNQILLFNTRGECPSNVEAAKSAEIQAAPAIVALNMQSGHADIQNVENSYWNAATVFGTIMSSGNPDDIPLQTIMDDLVESSETPEN